MKKITLILSAFLFLPFGITFAEETQFPSNPNHERIIDQADIFSEHEEILILNTIKEIEVSTTAQIAILTIPTLNGKDILEYGIELTERPDWQVGQDDKDNGLVLIIASDDRKYRFFTGYGIEGILPDVRLMQIAQKNIIPNFKLLQYGQGVQSSLHDIKLFLESDPEIISEYTNANLENNFLAIVILCFIAFVGGLSIANLQENPRNISRLGGTAVIGATILTPFILMSGGLIAVFLFWLASQPPREGGFGGDNKNDSDFFGILNSGGWSSGGGFSSGSGFSNFGGGDFGGGGFGGDW